MMKMSHFKIVMCLCLQILNSLSEPVMAEEKRIYQTDSLGNIQYHKPSYSMPNDGRIIETDPLGNKQYHRPQYQIKGDKVYQTDSLGHIQYHEPALKDK
jgi:hypothetical protein